MKKNSSKVAPDTDNKKSKIATIESSTFVNLQNYINSCIKDKELILKDDTFQELLSSFKNDNKFKTLLEELKNEINDFVNQENLTFITKQELKHIPSQVTENICHIIENATYTKKLYKINGLEFSYKEGEKILLSKSQKNQVGQLVGNLLDNKEKSKQTTK